jgi:predicted metalloprotease
VNAESVKVELQADCFAGVWGYHAQQAESSSPATSRKASRRPLPSATTALQKQTQGYVRPESFTHGSSAERVEHLRTGMKSGDPNDCTRGAAL